MKTQKLHNKAFRRLYVDPMYFIRIDLTAGKWRWTVVDQNARRGNRSWHVAGAEGYDDILEAAADAREAFENVAKVVPLED